MKMSAEEKGRLFHPRKMLSSRLLLQMCTLFTAFISFHFELGLVSARTHRLVEYTPKKCFNCFVETEVDAGGQSDESRIAIVVETMRLLARTSSTYQNIDRS